MGRLSKTIRIAGAAAIAAAFVSVASASTVTQLIHFDDAASNGVDPYTTADGNFTFIPTNLQSSVQCAPSTSSTGPANGRCLIEERNGLLTNMTRLTGDNTFSLDGFFFTLTGQGQASNNFIQIEDNNGMTAMFQLGNTYNTALGGIVSTFAGGIVEPLQALTEYYVDVSGMEGFDDIISIAFTALDSGQTRLDCISATFVGTTTDPISGTCGIDGGGGTNPNPIPLPAAGWLLIAGLGGLAAMKRRKS